ncbi:MAG: ATP phosphoribosyltransferase regulatory subunit [Candidatus Azotimanducaceae bacterium]|jgi:ATP phosphoribosyltransferase regulatory subunit
MSSNNRWLLPDGVDELLPPAALNLEFIRRRLLDLYTSWGYEYVIPPMIEFLESLLTGSGGDLDLKTFKVTDQISGRTLGIRADITPQVARMDAHSLNRTGITRLCYAGTALQTKPENMLASRAPLKLGAELFGSPGAEGDLEIVSLMIESLRSLGVKSVHLELGDVGIFRALMADKGISERDEKSLFNLIQQKSVASLRSMTEQLGLSKELSEMMVTLPTLCGTSVVIDKALILFKGMPEIENRLAHLSKLHQAIVGRFENLNVYFDLSELRGYAYHTGIVFAGYVEGETQCIAKGGRYDDVGEVFGRARSATGFDLDAKVLLGFVGLDQTEKKRVLAKANTDAAKEKTRWQKIVQLREEGYIVLESLADNQSYDLELIDEDGEWRLS